MDRFMALINRRATRPDTEHSISLRVFTYLCVALGIFVAAWYNELTGPMAGGLAGITAGYVFSYLRRGFTNWWLRVILSFGIIWSGWHYVAQMLFTSRDHVLVLTELLIVMQVMHSFDLPRRKDLVYSMLSAFMLICVGGILSRTMWYGLYLALFVVLSLIMLLLYHFQEVSHGALARGRPWQLAPMLAAFLGLILLGAPIFFVLMPRYETHAFAGLPVSGRVRSMVQRYSGQIMYPEPPNRLGSGPVILDDNALLDSSQYAFGDPYFGFMPTMNLNARGRFSGDLLMRVRTSSANYYRGLVFDRYEKGAWNITDIEGVRVLNRSSKSEIPVSQYRRQYFSNPYHSWDENYVYQTFYYEYDMPNLIYGALEPDDLYFPVSEIVVDRNMALRAAAIMRRGSVYTVVSRVPRYDPEQLRKGDAPCPEALQEMCAVQGIPERVQRHARQVTAGAANHYDQLMLLRRDLLDNTDYDLNAPQSPRDMDPVEFFLFHSRRGYCEHYASAFTLMARSLGIPARLVTGFSPGQYNPVTGFFEITGMNAHAWSEVYFPHSGWVPFDPTPPGPPGPIGMERVTPMSYFLDQYVTRARDALGAMVRAAGFGTLARGGVWAAGTLLAIAGLAAAGFALLAGTRRRAAHYPDLPDSNRAVIRDYHGAIKSLRGRGVPAPPSATPDDIAPHVDAVILEDFLALARLFEIAAYSPHTLSADDARAAGACRRRIMSAPR